MAENIPTFPTSIAGFVLAMNCMAPGSGIKFIFVSIYLNLFSVKLEHCTCFITFMYTHQKTFKQSTCIKFACFE